MSGPNANASQPRERDDLPALQDEPQLTPGLLIELERLGTLLDDCAMALADVKLAHSYAQFESNAHKLAGLAAHFAKSVTSQRPRPPHRSPNKE